MNCSDCGDCPVCRVVSLGADADPSDLWAALVNLDSKLAQSQAAYKAMACTMADMVLAA